MRKMDTPSTAGAATGPSTRPSVKIGMLPGTLIHLGEAPDQAVTVELHRYEGGGPLERRVLTDADEAARYRHAPGVTWIDVNGVHDVQLIERIGGAVGLHPLLLEDVVNTHQRPKLELHGEHLFLVLKMLLDDPETERFEIEQVSVVIGPGYVLTFQERERDTFDSVRRRLEDPATRLRQHGADFLAYALVDTIVDNYFAVLERVGDRARLEPPDGLGDRLRVLRRRPAARAGDVQQTVARELVQQRRRDVGRLVRQIHRDGELRERRRGELDGIVRAHMENSFPIRSM